MVALFFCNRVVFCPPTCTSFCSFWCEHDSARLLYVIVILLKKVGYKIISFLDCCYHVEEAHVVNTIIQILLVQCCVLGRVAFLDSYLYSRWKRFRLREK